MSEPTYIILHETVAQSIIKDATTFVMVLAIGAIGWWTGSRFLEVFGGLLLLVMILGRGMGGAKRLSPEQAIEYIRRIQEGQP